MTELTEVQLLNSLNKKLDVLISIFLQEKRAKEGLKDQDQVLYLCSFEFEVNDIARILAKKPNAINQLIFKLREASKLPKKQKGRQKSASKRGRKKDGKKSSK